MWGFECLIGYSVYQRESDSLYNYRKSDSLTHDNNTYKKFIKNILTPLRHAYSGYYT